MSIHDKHIELLTRANGPGSVASHNAAIHYLEAWRDGVRDALSWNDIDRGMFLMAAERHFLDLGVEWPMCGGLRLDWSE